MTRRERSGELNARREKRSGSGDAIQCKTRSIAVIRNLDIVTNLPRGSQLNIEDGTCSGLG